MTTLTQVEPLHLISVNTAPDRAKLVIGQFIEAVSGEYNIIHAGNTTTIEEVASLLKSTIPTPQILFCASMWTPEEQIEIQRIAKETIPGISTFAIPTGMQVREGPAFVLKFLVANVENLGIPKRA